MKPIGPIGKLQDLNLRDGDFVVCVDMNGFGVMWTELKPYKYDGMQLTRDCGTKSTATQATFQRLHHHDPRCFGFDEKTRGGYDAEILTIINGEVFYIAHNKLLTFQTEITNRKYADDIAESFHLVKLSPPTEFEVLGHRFATRKEAEDAMEIKEVKI